MTEQEALIVLENHECDSPDWDEAVLVTVAALRGLETLWLRCSDAENAERATGGQLVMAEAQLEALRETAGCVLIALKDRDFNAGDRDMCILALEEVLA